ncbi:sensor histidine kinase [Planctomycetota bacterium]
MSRRQRLGWPITLAVILIVLLIALAVGWILLTDQNVPLLAFGALSFVFIVVGVVMYLVLSIRSININQRQSNFIDSVTHELKSPIASLKLYLQTLCRRELSDNERQEFYDSMLEDVERLDKLINEILDAARLERGEQAAETQDVSLGDLIQECGDEVCQRHQVSRKTITYKMTPLVVHGAKVDLVLLFRNILDNAVKYGGDPPEVEVQMAELYNGRIAVRIADNGSGIPIRHRQRVFGRFVRLGTELEREKKGTGLGLYIASTLAKKLNGKVRVRGRDKTVGTIFEVTMPGRTGSVSAENDS